MQDQPISIETARLIPNPKQEKIWNKCPWFYVDTTHTNGYWMAERGDLDVDYPRPTQSLLQRYLREKHGIQVYAYSMTKNLAGEYMDWVYCIDGVTSDHRLGSYTYEQALELGLKQALNKLIK